jgi:hypothetical protein
MRLSVLAALFGAALLSSAAAGDMPNRADVRRVLDDQLGKSSRIAFVVAAVESDGPDGDLRLIPFDPPGWRPGRPPSITGVLLPAKIRTQFRHIGIADLAAHLRGKTVRVQAKVVANRLVDGEHYQESLVVQDITQFEAVEQH